MECYFAESALCEDLLGFREVIEYKSPTQVMRICRGIDIIACAKINFDTGDCTIYIHKNKDLTHERNHCRGWTHNEEQVNYDSVPWYPFNIEQNDEIRR